VEGCVGMGMKWFFRLSTGNTAMENPLPKTKKKVLCPLTIQSASKPPTQLDIFIFTQVYGALYLSLVFVIADIADCHIKV